MSKPREFYLRYRMGELYCDDFEALNDGPTGFHVIEKSAYDQQAKIIKDLKSALEFYADKDFHESRGEVYCSRAQAALTEAREFLNLEKDKDNG